MTASLSASPALDAVVVGSGPNGLTAAALLARAGLRVAVHEARDVPGGGCRSAELTLPGFVHDCCAAVHPMAALSPAFETLDLARHGLEWTRAPTPLAHPLPDGRAAVLERSLEATAATLGSDGRAWTELMGPLAQTGVLRSLLQPAWWTSGGHLLARARFGRHALRSCDALTRARFRNEATRALFAGCAAHAVVALDQPGTAAFGLVLAAAAHVVDWPCARGGSQAIVRALARTLEEFGGRMVCGHHIRYLRELPQSRFVLFDLHPRQVASIARDALPARYVAALERFRSGPGVFKLDWALSAPIPWRAPECRRATTVHVGGTYAEVLQAEAEMMRGEAPRNPFVLVAQPSLSDPSRAPAGCHTGWAYCHVPNGSTVDMTERIERQIERFAPGFRDCVLARHTTTPAQLEAGNPAMLGGDMAGGRNDLGQVFFRPVARWNPFRTPNPRLLICSSSTPPGGGVHGMCGYHAARSVLRELGLNAS